MQGLMPDRLRSLFGGSGRLRPPAALGGGNGRQASISVTEPPLRAELFSIDQLERHAKALAGWHQVAPVRRAKRGADRLLPRLKENEEAIGREYKLIAEAVKQGRRPTPAAEWFLDNYYLIEEQIRTARKHLPKGYSRELPLLISGASSGFPRVYDIALELISHTDGRVDLPSVRAFVAAYESVSSLRLGELWAIPITLRLALIENLRRTALRMAAARIEAESAAQWAEGMLSVAAKEPANIILILAEMVKSRPHLSDAFVAEFTARFRSNGALLVFPMNWIEQRLSERGQTIEQSLQRASQTQAANQVSVGNSISSLRTLGATDWRDFVEAMSAVEYVLRSDPAKTYAGMDFATRDQYRHAVEGISRHSQMTEEQVAQAAVDLAKKPAENGESAGISRKSHVGYYLIGRGRAALERACGMRHTAMDWVRWPATQLPLAVYLCPVLGIVAGVVWLVLWWGARHGIHAGGLAALGVLMAICASQMALSLVQWWTTLLISPKALARMDFSKGIPEQWRTVVAVPAMLIDEKEIDDLLESMEVRYLANRDPSLHFVLVSDFRDGPKQSMPEDPALLDYAVRGVEELNAKYGPAAESEDESRPQRPPGGGFFLFHRARQWNEQEQAWMGWERKRGKLEQFNAFLRGAKIADVKVVGEMEKLRDVKYVITLDSDTQLPRESAWKLVGTMAHPLNRPRFDPAVGRVVEGYGILQPRVAIDLPSSGRSLFARFFSGEPGIDPYTRAVSDVYQELFSEGSYVGKGIYDIDAFTQSLQGRLPENRILSHDLLEGAYARSGLVSDVLLLEEYPSAYPADVSRRHRWTRGDWQITPWLLGRVPGADARRVENPISMVSRWKILDNLRRSLVPASILTMLIAGFFLRGGAAFYTLVILGLIFLPAVLTGLYELLRKMEDTPGAYRIRMAAKASGRQMLEDILALAWLPYDAYVGLDAIGRSLVRVHITGRRLLEWRTAREAQRAGRSSLVGFYFSMWAAPVAAAGVCAAVVPWRRESLWFAAPFMALWVISPLVAWWLSQPIESGKVKLSPGDLLFLHTLARRTWRYFEAFVGPGDHYLPPDNYQEDPARGVAHRTSPTNIGISMLANLAAWDFGFISAARLMERTTQALGSLDKMQRYRGHFYNWYDTVTLETLRPMYVSTVDSGNLAGHLLILASGLSGMEKEKIIPASLFEGVRSALKILQQSAGEDRSAKGELDKLQNELTSRPGTLSGTYQWLRRCAAAAEALAGTAKQEEMKWWLGALREQCREIADDIAGLTPWVDVRLPAEAMWRHTAGAPALKQLEEIPTLGEIAKLEGTIFPALDRLGAGDGPDEDLKNLRAAISRGSERAAARLSELEQLALRCREFTDIEYDFLYDPARRLLSLGYNVSEHRLDAGYYDLLASEARLASFVAIAQGKLPQEHWFSLGRMLTTSGGLPALLSWSGSMFEYLMPLLVMPSNPRTLLDETYRAVVRRQIEYGRERGVPWGISESGYNKTDAELNYQYTAFGVPGLGFKRGLADELVIAPYASMMSLMVLPQAACANLRKLAGEGRMGTYGFYEAVDYTADRMPPGQSSVTVKSFMTHHQGMGFLSMARLLLNEPMQRRFDADPALRSAELLLHERVPRTPSLYPHPAEVSEVRGLAEETQANLRVFGTGNTAFAEVHLLSNGRYHVAITNAGGGYSRWRDLAVTRWHEDPARDCWGSFIYVRDANSGEFWSATHQPVLRRADSYEAIFSQGRAEFRRRDGDIDTYTEVAVSPEDDVELRRVSISNYGRTRRTIELTSYSEVVLASSGADGAHPAFSNLFVQTRLVPQRQAIVCTRRPRSAAEKPPWMMHLMTVAGKTVGEARYETSRVEFLGRDRTAADPAAMHRPALANTEGSVLDPIAAIRVSLILEPDETVRVNFVTGMSETEAGAMGLIEKYHDHHLGDRVFELAWTHSQVILRQLDATEADAQLYARLANFVLYSNPLLRAPGSVISQNRRGQSGLWGYGISGDLPIVLLRIGDQSQIQLVRQLVAAHSFWRIKGLMVDLVIWNEDRSGYRQSLQETILSIVGSRGESALLDKPGGIFVRRTDQMSEEDKLLMQTVARIILSDTAGTLSEQLDRRPRTGAPMPRLLPAKIRRNEPLTGVEVPRRDLIAFNGTGGFTPDGREYVIVTAPDRPAPAPWANVLANAHFGTIVTESGGSYTWAENAQAYRLTTWHNDWITDASGEAFYIRDEESGRFWSPTALPAPGPWPYTTRHGFGYTIYEYSDGEITSEMLTYVATDAPVKFVKIKLHNASGRARKLSVTGYFELVLGDRRDSNLHYVVTETDAKTGAIFARNSYHGEFGERIAFLDCSAETRTLSGDRTEFLGRNGRPSAPAAMRQTRLSGRTGAGFDPCAAMQAPVELAAGQEIEIVFLFGAGRDVADARSLINRFRGVEAARGSLAGVWDYWKRTLGVIYVQTPDALLNYMVNGWLLYQTLACRVWARSGYYQSSGAFGFRDQLQDVSALIHAEPALVRAHLLLCASHQFREGDVQHWWHPPSGRGVRTHISDDYLWLPYVTCRYVTALGDIGVLDEKAAFLDGRAVKPEEESYYDLPTRSEESATLYEHCVRAIKHGLRFGEHGLPLMGCGDWNDGMNLVGEKGKGESVWLGFFLYDVLMQFAGIAKKKQDGEMAELCTTQAAELRKNLELHGWDKEWYLRAYFDDGQLLGSATNDECKIDSLPQSWSVLSGAAPVNRRQLAMESVDTHLVNRDLKLIQLFEPPLDHTALNPGYIKGYLPGVRENGGQYTHAAVWAVMAFAQLGETEKAWEMFNMINPARHGDSESAIRRYKIEPYVVAGDVYTNIQHAGRGGWSWYTGSAGWMYRMVTESLLGIRLEVDHLRVAPLLPEGWDSITVHYRYRRTFHHIQVHKHGAGGVSRVTFDGVEQASKTIPLVDDEREHQVVVDVGNAPVPQPAA